MLEIERKWHTWHIRGLYNRWHDYQSNSAAPWIGPRFSLANAWWVKILTGKE